MHYLRLTVSFWILYLLLTGNTQVSNLVVGLLVAGGVGLLVRPINREFPWSRFPGAVVASLQYAFILLWDLALSGFRVGRIILFNQPINPGIIAIPSGCKSELGTALSAHAITVTPGEMVVEINEDGVMYTHCLDVNKASDYVQRAQDIRLRLLQRIFD